MKQKIQFPLRRETISSPEPPPLMVVKPLYQPPRIMVHGTVTQLTRGSGGAYDDECTSGHQPGDDE